LAQPARIAKHGHANPFSVVPLKYDRASPFFRSCPPLLHALRLFFLNPYSSFCSWPLLTMANEGQHSQPRGLSIEQAREMGIDNVIIALQDQVGKPWSLSGLKDLNIKPLVT